MEIPDLLQSAGHPKQEEKEKKNRMEFSEFSIE